MRLPPIWKLVVRVDDYLKERFAADDRLPEPRPRPHVEYASLLPVPGRFIKI